MFIDTSAIVAILASEDDADELSLRIEAAPRRMTSALVLLEASMRLSTLLAVEPEIVAEAVRAFLLEARIDVVPIGEGEAWLAVAAFARFGKGRGGPAQLNLADCLSYACAKGQGVPLLYKGFDFAATDIA